MDKFIQIDIFGLSVFVENKHEQQIMYTIEPMDGFYNCFVQRRASRRSRWSKKRLVESSKQYLKFEYADTESGFKMERQ